MTFNEKDLLRFGLNEATLIELRQPAKTPPPSPDDDDIEAWEHSVDDQLPIDENQIGD